MTYKPLHSADGNTNQWSHFREQPMTQCMYIHQRKIPRNMSEGCGRHPLSDPNNPCFLIFMASCSFLPLSAGCIQWLASNKGNAAEVVRCQFWEISLQSDSGLCWARSHSSVRFPWGKPAALWADIWGCPPGKGLQATASEELRPSGQQPWRNWISPTAQWEI